MDNDNRGDTDGALDDSALDDTVLVRRPRPASDTGQADDADTILRPRRAAPTEMVSPPEVVSPAATVSPVAPDQPLAPELPPTTEQPPAPGQPFALVEPLLRPRSTPAPARPATPESATANSATGTHTTGTHTPTNNPADTPGLTSAVPTGEREIPSTFYRFRISSTVVTLDSPAYIGRLPVRPRVIQGRAPRLVRVPSPLKEVSGSHLEIRQHGSSVVLTDLRSTNGSVVNVPGAAPHKLLHGESMVVSPGTLVDIGDGNVVEILPMQRL